MQGFLGRVSKIPGNTALLKRIFGILMSVADGVQSVGVLAM